MIGDMPLLLIDDNGDQLRQPAATTVLGRSQIGVGTPCRGKWMLELLLVNIELMPPESGKRVAGFANAGDAGHRRTLASFSNAFAFICRTALRDPGDDSRWMARRPFLQAGRRANWAARDLVRGTRHPKPKLKSAWRLWRNAQLLEQSVTCRHHYT